jgi:hypothetical protein
MLGGYITWNKRTLNDKWRNTKYSCGLSQATNPVITWKDRGQGETLVSIIIIHTGSETLDIWYDYEENLWTNAKKNLSNLKLVNSKYHVIQSYILWLSTYDSAYFSLWLLQNVITF